jgi:hypothetical protein
MEMEQAGNLDSRLSSRGQGIRFLPMTCFRRCVNEVAGFAVDISDILSRFECFATDIS